MVEQPMSQFSRIYRYGGMSIRPSAYWLVFHGKHFDVYLRQLRVP